MKIARSHAIGISVVLMCAAAGAAEVRAVDWSPHGAHRGCRVNLGPTGAAAWMREHLFHVMTVEAGSPAEGVLRPGDLILGAGDRRFAPDADSRRALGDAIGRAEATDGALSLTIRRDGEEREVLVKLPVSGPFAPDWPFGCAKSQRILHEACEYILRAQQPNGEIPTDGGMGTFTGGLLLLASGEARFLDGARRAAYATAAMELEKTDLHNWALGYAGVFLAEYYLATGDATVLDRLRAFCDHLAQGQMRCGSWGHKGPAEGYGAMNQAGIIAALALTLARECGVEVNAEALQRALAFYGRYAELGAVPYGDQPPGVEWPDDNGKNSSSAVLFALHSGWERPAAVFAQSVALSYWLREEGHTGGFFSIVWGPLACDRAGARAFREFMDYQSWYYHLARTWRGALVMLPYHEALTRFDDSSYVWFGGEWTTGGMALVFALPRRELRILGAPRSVFGAKLQGAPAEAREAYLRRDWPAFDAALERARKENAPEHLTLQLARAAERVRESARLTVREIENNIAEGDPYRAEEQYLALKRFRGADDETLAGLDARFADGTIRWYSGAGKRFYDAGKETRTVAIMSWLPYGETAKSHMGDFHVLRPPLWETLVPVSADTSRSWQKSASDGRVSGEIPFALDTADYVALRLRFRSPRDAHTQVFLNGTLVANILRGQRSGYAKIELDESALSLLRPGANAIRVVGTSVGADNNALDVGLDGVRRERPLPRTPERTADAPLPIPDIPPSLRAAYARARANYVQTQLDGTPNPAVPEPLRVRDSQDRFRKALLAACDMLSEEELIALLRSPIPYVRHLSSQSLARRGAAGLARAIAGTKDADWRARAAACDALAAMGETAANAPEILAGIVALLEDESAWVRFRAAQALSVIGRPHENATGALVRSAADADPWVRAAALGALGKLTKDRDARIAAVRQALLIPHTSFAVVSRSLALIEQSGASDSRLIPSLVFAIEHPGEGSGAQILGKAMELLTKLDTEGAAAAATLARVAAGGAVYDRLRGHPRRTAIELLGTMGPKAAAAVPALENILAGADEDKSLQDAARDALARIRPAL